MPKSFVKMIPVIEIVSSNLFFLDLLSVPKA